MAAVWAVSAAAALALTPVWRMLAQLLPPCGFRHLTGLPCPTCGTTRAGLALLAGDLPGAFAHNPAAATAGLAFLAGGMAAAMWALFRGPMPVLPLNGRPVRLALAASVMANWAYLFLWSPQ